jgi:hypothetical protein
MTILIVATACIVGVAGPARAQTPAPAAAAGQAEQQIREELQRLRQEFEAIRDLYGARLAALESRLGQVSGGAAAPVPGTAAVPAVAAPGTQTAAQPTQTVPAGAAGAGGPEGVLPVYGNVSAASKIFNPDIAVIGNFIGAAGKNEIEPRPALQLDEAELSLQAIVDPYARADFFLAASPEGLDVEEGFITFPTLPGGLLMKAGKLKAQFGKANTFHSHQMSTTDQPIVIRNLLGGDEGLSDSGISVSKLILNPVLFLEATGEIYQGQNDLFTSHKRGNLGYVGRLRGYRDVTEATNLDFGTSFAYGHNDVSEDSTTRVFGIDATLRYRPLRRAIYRRVLARTELMWSRRDEASEPIRSFGMYASADYQFARRWFAGGRYDWSERAYDSSLVDKGPSLLLTYWPSEFSQIRGQYRHTRYAEGVNANELLFQFLFSIGAHGAHVF